MLWFKVIIRAIYDYITYRDSSKLQHKKIAESAEIWLFHQSEVFNSFSNLCLYLSLNPVIVRQRILKMSKEDAKKIEYLDRVESMTDEEREEFLRSKQPGEYDLDGDT